MKTINTYGQQDVTWFNHKHLFKLKYSVLYALKDYPESELMSWIAHPDLHIKIKKTL